MEQKEKIREKYRAMRKELTADDCINRSHKITNNFLGHWMFDKKTIDCFLPIHRLREVETKPLINHLKRNNIICLPVSNFEQKSMEHRILDDHIQFQDNSHGIPEPLNGKNAPIEDIDVVIVPLLAVDKDGNRLGYGKGFYDRFLAQCNEGTLFIGLTMFDIHNELIEPGPYDVPLHYVVTPKGILKTGHAFELEEKLD